MNSTYDVVVVGAGVGGALIAWKLADAGYKVLMLEAGASHHAPDDRSQFVKIFTEVTNDKRSPSRPYIRFPDDSQKFATSPDVEDFKAAAPGLYYQQQSATNMFFLSQYQRLVGGSTWAWRGNCPRFIPSDFELKTRYGVGVDWPISYDDIEPWFCDAEDELGVSGNTEEWDGYLNAYRSRAYPMDKIVQSVGDRELITRTQGLMVGDTEVKIFGIPQARNSQNYDGRPACHGNSTCIPICPIQAKYDATVHVKKAVACGAELRDHAVVTELVADGAGRINAVKYKAWDGREQTVSGKIVVLAAHAIETVKILLMSNGGQGLANRSTHVGCNLMDHPGGEVAAVMPVPVYPFRGPQSTSGIDSFRDHNQRDKFASFRLTIGNDGWGRTKHPYSTLTDLTGGTLAKPTALRYGQDLRDELEHVVTRQIRIAYATEQLPLKDNRVQLHPTEKDELGIPKPMLTYSVDSYVLNGAKEAQRVIDLIFDAADASKTERERTDLSAASKKKYSGSAHIMGTTRMGSDPMSSVVDSDCRAHDHPNLFIAGSGVFPTGAAANPTLMIAALALRTSEVIANDLC